MGRIINSDGTFGGQEFILSDVDWTQNFPDVVYIQERVQYFAAWNDSRNGDIIRPIPVSLTGADDIYANWLNPSGEPVGLDFPLCTGENNQSYPEAIYNPDMDNLLIIWANYLYEVG